ncbi:hypothetical protein ACTXQV_71805, partial [Klebsiella pneumoniae]
SQLPAARGNIGYIGPVPERALGLSAVSGRLAAALATKACMQELGLAGTVKYFGCPAEEGGGGKAYMARAGLFDGVDVAFT